MKFSSDRPTHKVFRDVNGFLTREGFTITETDADRPWGGYFVIAEREAMQFIERFFPQTPPDEFTGFPKLSPKILLVAPQKRLSWQYHHRRAEIWSLIAGKAGVMVSETDRQTELQELKEGQKIELKQGQRHRLVGLDEWGVVAEIWKHSNPDDPSDEEDIVRVQDDFGRENS
ncbi:MAG: phosphoheptose isomerase [Balneolaceae bacterium]